MADMLVPDGDDAVAQVFNTRSSAVNAPAVGSLASRSNPLHLAQGEGSPDAAHHNL